MVQLLVYPVLPARMPEKEINVNTECVLLERHFVFMHSKESEHEVVSVCVRELLVVVFFLLLSPVLVELVDFNSSVALLKQVERLCMKQKPHICL